MQHIYKIRNKINGKYYIGRTYDLEKRWREHRRGLARGSHYNVVLQRAWNKYGKENFTFEAVEEIEGTREGLIALERVYLDKGFERGKLYNISRSADRGGNLGEDVNQQKKEWWTSERRAENGKRISGKNNPNYGKDMSGENSPRWGKPCSEETKTKLRMVNLGENSPKWGKHPTKETRAKMSEAAAKPYPAFYNVKTDQLIPASRNLWKLCQERGLNYATLSNLKGGYTKRSYDGWRLATERGSL